MIPNRPHPRRPTGEEYHALQMMRTPALSQRQFPNGDQFVDRVEQIKRKAMVRATPRFGNTQPYIPYLTDTAPSSPAT